MIIKFKFCLFFATFLFSGCFLKAQEYYPGGLPFTTPSPNAVQFSKYTNIPVGHYTGSANVSVPIWTITLPNFTLPLSLDYRTGGVKVSEIASSVGLSWNLSAGGAISRAIVGLSDEGTNGFISVPKPNIIDTPVSSFDLNLLVQLEKGEADHSPDNYYFNFCGLSGRFTLDRQGNIHTIPLKKLAIRKGSVGNYGSDFPELGPIAGRGIKSWEISDGKGNTYIFQDLEQGASSSLDLANLSSNWSVPRVDITSWYLSKIITAGGEEILFTYEETFYSYDRPISKTINKKVADAHGTSGEILPLEQQPITRQYQFAKKLKTITYPAGQVDFVYSPVSRADLVGDKALKEVIVRNSHLNQVKKMVLDYAYLKGTELKSFADVSVGPEEGNLLVGNNNSAPNSFDYRLMLTSVKEVDQSGSPDASYRFEYHHDIGLPIRSSFAQDYWGYANGSPDLFRYVFLDDLSLYKEQARVGVLDKGPDLGHAIQGSLKAVHFPEGGSNEITYESNTVPASDRNLPIEIESDLISPSFGIVYSNYNNLSYPYQMRSAGLGGQQKKCYYHEFIVTDKGINITTDLEIVITGFPSLSAGEMNFSIEKKDVPSVFENDQAVWLGTGNGTFHVSLPAGTYLFIYTPVRNITPSMPIYDQLHGAVLQYNDYKIKSRQNEPEAAVGGLRIQSIKEKEPNSTYIHKYKYVRTGDQLSSGRLFGLVPEFKHTSRFWVAGDPDGVGQYDWYEQTYLSVSTNSIYPLSTTQGSYVGYSQVEEYKCSADGTELFKKIYSFDHADDSVFSSVFNKLKRTFPNPPIDNRDWKRGRQVGLDMFEKKNGIYQKMQSELFVYQDSVYNVADGMQAHYFSRKVNQQIGGIIVAVPYSLTSGLSYLLRTEKSIYENGVEKLKTTVSNTLNKSNQEYSRVEETSSNGRHRTSYFLYPGDYSNSTGTIGLMKTKHMISYLIESVHQVQDNLGSSVVSGRLFDYSAAGKGSVDRVSDLNLLAPLASSSFKFSNRAIGVSPLSGTAGAFAPDANYKLVYEVLNRDTYGNPLSLKSKENALITYLWGYGGQYPIAEIKNATYAEVLLVLNQSTIDNLNNPNQTEAAMETLIKNAAATLRTDSRLSKAMVTSYTYKPLVGMTSKTDPRGVTEYYQYDGMQRLKAILDQFKDVTKAMDYHYRSN